VTNKLRVLRVLRGGAFSAALLCVLTVSGCGGNSSTSPSTSTEFFIGLLGTQGEAFYSFTAAAAGSVEVTLVSMTLANPGPALVVPVTIGIGTPAGEGCTVTSTVSAAPGFSAQLTSQVATGIYCINIQDPGSLTGTVDFAIRIVHP
jgi:hypothetical protein